MQVFNTVVFIGFRHFKRVFIVGFLRAVIAFGKTHTFPVDNIYGWNNSHKAKKLDSS